MAEKRCNSIRSSSRHKMEVIDQFDIPAVYLQGKCSRYTLCRGCVLPEKVLVLMR